MDGLGFVRRLLTSPGQHANCRHAEALTKSLKPVVVVGDKGYDSDKLRNHWQRHRLVTGGHAGIAHQVAQSTRQAMVSTYSLKLRL